MDKFKNILIIALAVAFVFGQIKSCQQDEENLMLMSRLQQINTSLQEFKVQRKADSSTLAKQGQKILEQREAIEQGLLKLEKEMKRAIAQVKFGYDIIIDSVDVPFIPKGYADTTNLLSNYEKSRPQVESVPVPQPFAVSKKWFSIAGEVRKSGLMIDSISIPNSSSVTIGYERKNIFHKLKPVVSVANENPYLRLNSMNNVVIKEKKGIFQSKLFWFALGSVATMIGIIKIQ